MDLKKLSLKENSEIDKIKQIGMKRKKIIKRTHNISSRNLFLLKVTLSEYNSYNLQKIKPSMATKTAGMIPKRS
ncbi:MAG: hypothetical protein ACTSUN_04035 [Promethearchaeota archaeon]